MRFPVQDAHYWSDTKQIQTLTAMNQARTMDVIFLPIKEAIEIASKIMEMA